MSLQPSVLEVALLPYGPQNAMYLAGFGSGVVLHLALLKKGEWDLVAHKIFWSECLHMVTILGLIRISLERGDIQIPWLATLLTALYAAMHATGILLSMFIYRGFFHRIRHFPGPVLAGFSNFYVAISSLKKWRLYEDVQQMHSKYGDYVRVGPNELSISDPAAIPLIYNTQSPCTRGPICNLSPRRYVYSLDRDKSTHQNRRRHWIKAFGAKALQDYDGIISKHVKSLEDFLKKQDEQPMNMTDVMAFISFDITFETVYGKESHCVSENKEDIHIRTMQGLKTEVQPVQHLPWIVSLGQIYPWPQGYYTMFSRQSDKLVEEQLRDTKSNGVAKNGTAAPIAFKYFLEAYHNEPDRKKALEYLKGDSDLSLLAGWDNTATTLVAVLYHLSQSPKDLAMVRHELNLKSQEFAASMPSISGMDAGTLWYTKLADCNHLNAVIKEAMRMHPTLGEGVQRQTPNEGLQVGDTFIPGKVVVNMPHYTLSRDERFFADAYSFRPERWTSNPEMVRNENAYMPFGVGLSPCPGRLFAMRIMRAVIAAIVLKRDVNLAPGVPDDVLLRVKYEKFNTVFGPIQMVLPSRS